MTTSLETPAPRLSPRAGLPALALAAALWTGCDADPTGDRIPPPNLNSPALADHGALVSRPFQATAIDRSRLGWRGSLSAFKPELERPLIEHIRTTTTRVCEGESFLADARATAESGLVMTVQGQRVLPALVTFHAAGQRPVRVEARVTRNGKLVAIDRRQVMIDVVECPDRPLAELTATAGETPNTVEARVYRVQGLAGGERVDRQLEGLRYRFDFGDGTVVESDHPAATHRYDVSKLPRGARPTQYLQVTATDSQGVTAFGRRPYAFRAEPRSGPPVPGAIIEAMPMDVVDRQMRQHEADLERNAPKVEAEIERLRAQAMAEQAAEETARAE